MNQIIKEDMAFVTSANLPWEQLDGKTVLITGANGFLPAYLVETLLYLNAKKGMNIKILALVRNKKKALARFSEHLCVEQLQFIVQDVCDPLIGSAFQSKIDVIIHAASQASPKYYATDPVGTLKANTLGTYNLLELARANSTEKFLFFSSGEIYGVVPENEMPIKEGYYGGLDPVDVRSCYGESKRLGETLCVAFSYQYGINTTIVRPFHTYGPGMALDDGRVFADFVNDVVCKRNIVVKGDGFASRNFCYLADATVGFFTVLFKGANTQVYNVSDDKHEISIGELAILLTSLFPDLGLTVIKTAQQKPSAYLLSKNNRVCPSIEKIKLLGWKPTYSINEGFSRTIRSFL